MLANWITLSRLPLLAISILALLQPPPQLRLAGVAVLLLGLFLDTVDGVVARKVGDRLKVTIKHTRGGFEGNDPVALARADVVALGELVAKRMALDPPPELT